MIDENNCCKACRYSRPVPTEKWDFTIYCSKLNFVIPNANDMLCTLFKEPIECTTNLK